MFTQIILPFLVAAAPAPIALKGWSLPVVCVPADRVAYDGDTPYCLEAVSGSSKPKRITKRLWAVQAPEIRRNKCYKIECIPGDPYASRDALIQQITAGNGLRTYRYRVHPDGSPALDPYGRMVVLFYSNGTNIVCPLLKSGLLIHKKGYDRKGLLLRECGVSK